MSDKERAARIVKELAAIVGMSAPPHDEQAIFQAALTRIVNLQSRSSDEMLAQCDGRPLASTLHLWSDNTLIQFNDVREDDEGEETIGQLNGKLKHCELCGVTRFVSSLKVQDETA